jgi:2-keto-3-deoxy-6-phosphogluconate aldolase
MSFRRPVILRGWSLAAVLMCVLSTTSHAQNVPLRVNPVAVSFGNCAVGANCAAQTVRVTNISPKRVEIQSASLSSLQFAYSGPALPIFLEPGQSFSGSVLFLPSAAQTYGGRLIFEATERIFGSKPAELVAVQLTGTGTVAPAVPASTPTPAPAPVTKTTPTISWAAPAAITYRTVLNATQLDATANTAGTFAYSPAPGTVLGAGSHTLLVTFTPSDTTDYNTATGSVTLTVNKVTPTITWGTPAAINYGTALSATQLDATASVAGSFAYSPGLGTVIGSGSQTLLATFTPSDTTDYNTATDSVTLTVNQGTTSITWPTPSAINYGTALSATQLDATANTAGSFVYSPALGTVLNAGSQTLSVTFTPANTTAYHTATASVVLTVNKVTPTIMWAAPAAITSGTALSSTQLDATANTGGSFAYSPALGTVLSAGSQTLSVTFTPSNTTDYNSATGSVVLTVNGAAPATGTLTVNPTSVTLGNVIIGANSSETVTLKNSGSGSVTISNVSISAPGVSVSGVSSGMVLSSGQSASLEMTFTASGTGSVTGGVTVASNASNSSLTIPMSASGVSPSVSLSWSADAAATGGYEVYSSTVSGGPYNLLTSTPVTTPNYTDNTVQAGSTYYYVVTAIDASTNVQSGYSNQAAVVVP